MECAAIIERLKQTKSYPLFSQVLAPLITQLSCCLLCGQNCAWNKQLCSYCQQDLIRFNYQHIDGDLLNWPAINQILPKAQFDRLVCLAPHQWPMDHWLRQLKYQRHFQLAPLLAELFVNQWQALTTSNHSCPELITCVPMHISRWQQRGFNQSHLIARTIAQQLAIPYQPALLSKIKPTTAQVGQSGQQRRRNLKDAFAIASTEDLPKHIMLVDDVVTTGSTANEIVNLLKRHGVRTVTLAAITLALAPSA